MASESYSLESLEQDHRSLSEAVHGMLGDIRIMHQRLLLLEDKVAALQEFKEAVSEEVVRG